MSRLPFKRHLVILAICLLAVVAIVPIATFAKSSSGEPHRPIISTKVTQSVDPSTGDATRTTTTDASCTPASAAVIISPVLHPGDVVHLKANLVPTGTETVQSEQSEGEFLTIFDTSHTITTVDYLHNTVDLVGINATANNVLKACIINADADEQATVSVSTPITNLGDKVINTIKVGKDIISIVKLLLGKVSDPFLFFIITPAEKCIIEGGHGPDCVSLEALLNHPPKRFQV